MLVYNLICITDYIIEEYENPVLKKINVKPEVIPNDL